MSDIMENIDIDLSSVSLSRPLLDNQVKQVRIGDAKVEKNDAGLRKLVLPLTLEEPATAEDGREVQPGFQITHSFLIDPTGGLTETRIAEELKHWKAAALATRDPKVMDGPFGSPQQLVNKVVTVKFGIRIDRKDSTKRYQDVKVLLPKG